MKHNIVPVINEYFSCHQALFATYASYQKRDYDMIFAESWGFKYERGDYPFGKSLEPGYQNRRELLLEKFHSIVLKEQQYKSKEKAIELLQATLPDSPIMLHCDVFDCPWNISYKRNHIDHHILIIGIDEDAINLYVLDPYSTKDENIIAIDSIIPENGQVHSFITMSLNKPLNDEYHMEINNNLDYIKSSDFFQNFENFKNDFPIRFEEVIQSEYIDVYAIPIIINLRRIANQRYCFCIFLKKMINKGLIDSSMLKLMESVAEKYGLLRILLIKQIMKKKKSEECVDILNDIMSSEYRTFEKIKLCI